jgi:hypothetical protein
MLGHPAHRGKPARASSPQGKHLGAILLPEPGANVEFSDAGRKSLYIVASIGS